MASRPDPRDPDDLRVACATRFTRAHRQWLADPSTGEADVVRLSTAPPTAANAAENPDETAAWIRRWREFESTTGESGEHVPSVRVTWAERRLPGFGTTALPQRVEVLGADAIARVAGQTARWEQLRGRTRRMLDLGPDHIALGRVAASTSTTWEFWDDDTIDRLLAVCRWALANPTAGLRAREIAVPGVDTKWIETRTRVVEKLLHAAAGAAVSGLGLRGPDIRVRMRVLDPDLALGLRDVESPVDQLATLWRSSEGPRRVVVVENLTTFLALPDLPGTVALFGRGFAVDAVAALPWVLRAHIAYWGDLDSHGFAILDRLRHHAPHAVSVLMDTATLEAWREYAVPDTSPTRTAPTRLTTDEVDALEALTTAGDLRLEQERIPWDWVLPRLRAAWTGSESPSR